MKVGECLSARWMSQDREKWAGPIEHESLWDIVGVWSVCRRGEWRDHGFGNGSLIEVRERMRVRDCPDPFGDTPDNRLVDNS